MKRKEFLMKGFSAIGMLTIVPVISCSNDSVDPETSGEAGTTGISDGGCTVTATETAGPFPTKSPAEHVLNDIRLDRQGTPLAIKITVQTKSNNCAALENALVDIWHCDAGGNYSEYGGSGMQSANFTNAHFLRGRQTTDATGVVTFTSIYPGWYSGRAPHIHVHIYNASGKSLLVTQIAFPENISGVVYAQGVYVTHGQADTGNARDNIFRDGTATEMPVVMGSTSAGYELTHTIVVNS